MGAHQADDQAGQRGRDQHPGAQTEAEHERDQQEGEHGRQRRAASRRLQLFGFQRRLAGQADGHRTVETARHLLDDGPRLGHGGLSRLQRGIVQVRPGDDCFQRRRFAPDHVTPGERPLPAFPDSRQYGGQLARHALGHDGLRLLGPARACQILQRFGQAGQAFIVAQSLQHALGRRERQGQLGNLRLRQQEDAISLEKGISAQRLNVLEAVRAGAKGLGHPVPGGTALLGRRRLDDGDDILVVGREVGDEGVVGLPEVQRAVEHARGIDVDLEPGQAGAAQQGEEDEKDADLARMIAGEADHGLDHRLHDCQQVRSVHQSPSRVAIVLVVVTSSGVRLVLQRRLRLSPSPLASQAPSQAPLLTAGIGSANVIS